MRGYEAICSGTAVARAGIQLKQTMVQKGFCDMVLAILGCCSMKYCPAVVLSEF